MQIALLFFIWVENEHHSIQKSTFQIDNLPRTFCTFSTISLLNIHPWVSSGSTRRADFALGERWRGSKRKKVPAPILPILSALFPRCVFIRGHSPQMLGMKSFLRSQLLKRMAMNSFRSAPYLLLEQQTLHWGADSDFETFPVHLTWVTHTLLVSVTQTQVFPKTIFFFFYQKEINRHLKTFCLFVRWYFQRNTSERYRYLLYSH